MSTTTQDRALPVRSTLDQKIYVPWQENFELGFGYDFLSRKPLVSALDPVVAATGSATARTMNIRYVKSQQDFEREVSGSVSASTTAVEGVKMEVSTDFLSKVQYSSSQETLLISWYGANPSFDRVTGPKLTARAAAALSDPDRFRLDYGDYFFSGGLRHAEFHAMYVISASNSESLQKFHAAIAASGQDLFDAQASAAFSQKASSMGVSISVYTSHTPASGNPPATIGHDVQGSMTPSAVGQYFEWFKANTAPGYVVAELTHYSALDDRLSRSVGIPPAALETLSDLDLAIVSARRTLNTLPALQRAQLEPELSRIAVGADAERDQLWTDPHVLDDGLDAVRSLSERMRTYTEFFRRLQELAGGERHVVPGGGEAGIGANGDTTTVPADLTVHTVSLPVRATWEVGNITRHCEWSAPQARIIHVKVSSPDPSSTRGECSNLRGGVGADNIRVGFTAFYDRGLNWNVEVKYVEVG